MEKIKTYKIPELVITEKSYRDVLSEIVDAKTLIVVDAHNLDIGKEFGDIFLVSDNKVETLEILQKKAANYKNIVAMGACTALDLGKLAGVGKRLLVIPTLLSTSCISVNRSVIHFKDRIRSISSQTPEQTIICINEHSNLADHVLVKWCQSGYGDLFANISAAIDYNFKTKGVKMELEDILRDAKIAFDAIDYVLDKKDVLNREGIKKLAEFIHESSLEVINRGNAELSAGWEHKLYYEVAKDILFKHRNVFTNYGATHGQIVAIGSLLNIEIFCRFINDHSLFLKTRQAFVKLGLPVTLKQVKHLGITEESILKVLRNLNGDFFLKHAPFAMTGNQVNYTSLLSEVFHENK